MMSQGLTAVLYKLPQSQRLWGVKKWWLSGFNFRLCFQSSLLLAFPSLTSPCVKWRHNSICQNFLACTFYSIESLSSHNLVITTTIMCSQYWVVTLDLTEKQLISLSTATQDFRMTTFHRHIGKKAFKDLKFQFCLNKWVFIGFLKLYSLIKTGNWLLKCFFWYHRWLAENKVPSGIPHPHSNSLLALPLN